MPKNNTKQLLKYQFIINYKISKELKSKDTLPSFASVYDPINMLAEVFSITVDRAFIVPPWLEHMYSKSENLQVVGWTANH